METTDRDKQRQTLCCHFESQEHPPAKSELLRQPPASCRAQVMICIPVSAARTGVKEQKHDWGFLHSSPQDFKEAELGFVWTFSSWQQEISFGEPQSVENSSSVVCSFIQVQAVWEHWILFSLKFCNFSYNSCYQATDINGNTLSQWKRQFIRVAWCPNTIIMRTALNR